MAANNIPHGQKNEILVIYTECLRNHAAKTEGYAVDGCGLFKAGGPSGTAEAVLCAACRCHRNFHRTIVVEISPRLSNNRTENNLISEEEGVMVVPSPLPAPPVCQPSRRERMTREQNERLRAIAESNGWKPFRDYSKEEVSDILSEIGIEREVLKNWINNRRRKRAVALAAASANAAAPSYYREKDFT